MATENNLIEFAGVDFSYSDGEPILDGMDFHLQAVEKVGIVGPNGSGKTTFFHLLMGLALPTGGEIRLFGQNVQRPEDFVVHRSRLGLLFQDADDQLFCPTVIEDVAFGPLNQGKSAGQARTLAMSVLEQLGIGELAERVTYQLSGGEKKMVSLATVLAMEPDVLLLDEPTNGLDEKTKARITEVLLNLDLAYVVISHDFDFLAQVTGNVYAMEKGKLLAGAEEIMHKHFHVHRHGNHPHQHSH